MTRTDVKKVLWLKFLEPKGVPPLAVKQGSKYRWPLPHAGKKGRWTTPLTDLHICKRGYHLTDLKHAVFWTQPELYIAEVEIQDNWEEFNSQRNYVTDSEAYKVAFRKVRLVRRVRKWNVKTARRMILKIAIRAVQIATGVRPENRKKLLRALRLCLRQTNQRNLTAFLDMIGNLLIPSNLESVLHYVSYGDNGGDGLRVLRDLAMEFRDASRAWSTGNGSYKAIEWMAGLFRRETGLKGRSL